MSVWKQAVGRGAGFSLAWIVVEAADRLRVTWESGFLAPTRVALISTLVLAVLGVVLSLCWSRILKRDRGDLWHPLGLITTATALHLGFAALAGGAFLIKAGAVSLAVGLLYAGCLVLARRSPMAWVLSSLGVALAALLLWLAPLTGKPEYDLGRRPAAPENAPNVLFIVLDTVRTDRLGMMGYERDTFPYLTEIAREGAVFERALSPAPWTLPSHASMFTGLYPSTHGAHHENTFLADDRMTLAEILYRQGWETATFSANPWISSATGMTQGFAWQSPVWLDQMVSEVSFAWLVARALGWLEPDNNGRAVTRRWLDWLSDWREERPFFVFLNYLETHFPHHNLPDRYLSKYSPPGTEKEELAEASLAVMKAELHGWQVNEDQAARVNELYDASIRYENELVKDAIEALRERGELDNTVVVLVSDHGDLLGEHGGLFQHTRSLVNYLLSVPLVIRYPPRIAAGHRVERSVTTAALMPTLLDLMGLQAPPGIQTRSFAPLLEDAEAAVDVDSPLLAEGYAEDGRLEAPDFQPRSLFDRLRVRYRSLEEDGFKLIVDSTGKRWLFEPLKDPDESVNLIDARPDVAERLEQRLAELVAAKELGALDRPLTAGESPELDAETREHLRALGYVQ